MQIYATDNDFTTSLRKALDDIDPRWESYPGLIIAGTHTPTDVKEKIQKIKEARWNKTPFLGICFGYQLMVIEYAQNVLGKVFANSTELDPETNFPVVVKTNDLRVGLRNTVDIEGAPTLESFWHNYKVNNEYLAQYIKDWKFTQVYDSVLSESIVDHMIYKPSVDFGVAHMGVQFHPEYQSSKENPHWVFKYFLTSCKYIGQKASAN